MAENTLLETNVLDLLERMKKIESFREEIDKYLPMLDKELFALSIALKAFTDVLITKGVITEEEMKKAADDTMNKYQQSLKGAKPETGNG